MGSVTEQNSQRSWLKIVVLVGAATFAMVISTSDFAYYVPDMAVSKMEQSPESLIKNVKGTKKHDTHTVRGNVDQAEYTSPATENIRTLSEAMKGFLLNYSTDATVLVNDQNGTFLKTDDFNKDDDHTLEGGDENQLEDIRITNQYLSATDGNKSDEVSVDEEFLNQHQKFPVLQLERMQNIHNACNTPDLFQEQLYKGNNSTNFYYSLKYNFSYCKVPKSGSTFWTQVFAILKYGHQYADYFFQETRMNVHRTTAKFRLPFITVKTARVRTILVSRDPYSRLYSAYVDKVYLPLMYNLSFDILDLTKKSLICSTNVTFQQFLQWVIDKAKNGKTLNRHWAPIVSLCRPCDVNAFMLVKQETFSHDVEFVLNQVGVEKNIQDFIVNALHDHRAELSLPGIIETYYSSMAGKRIQRCYTYRMLARRIWRSFQIQGYINERIPFPHHNFAYDDRAANSSYLSDIVLQTIREDPMTSSQSKWQRHKFLIEAYRNIQPDVVAGLQELYKQDFEMFGYSKQPPTDNMLITF